MPSRITGTVTLTTSRCAVLPVNRSDTTGCLVAIAFRSPADSETGSRPDKPMLRVDKFLSRRVLYKDRATQDALHLHRVTIQPVDVALVESGRRRKHLQRGHEAEKLPIYSRGQRIGEAHGFPLKLVALGLRHLPQQHPGEDEHRKKNRRNESRQMPSGGPPRPEPAWNGDRRRPGASAAAGATERVAAGGCRFGGFRSLPHRWFARA